MKNNLFRDASYIASPFFAAFTLLACFVSAYAGLLALSGFLLFLCLLSLCALVWGRFCAYGLTADIRAQSYRTYPGQQITLHFTLQNDKCLPLPWLTWLQPCPPNGCLSVPEDFEISLLPDAQTRQPTHPTLCKGFSFIKWYATLQWSSTCTAVRRGVYHPQTISLQTGDGFGLCVRKNDYSLPSAPIFVIYPQRVPVKTDAFFKNAWSASTGTHGVIEDVTVLRSTRDYLPNDSFKRINWRMAARNDALSVNVYDMIAPQTVTFFVDTATFHGISDDNAAFERTLSVIGSLISALDALHMQVQLCLPLSGASEGESENTTPEDCLLALALADCDHPQAQFSQQSLSALLSAQAENVYYVCYDAVHSTFLHNLEAFGAPLFSIISHQNPQDHPEDCAFLADLRISPLANFEGVS